mmetsp:Transcript_24456/g.76676  ORF Transcript_24456/g.76676 Transcript_24456/m.76676 type:complete len:256 (-) Transcript_24456:65-832(-)
MGNAASGLPVTLGAALPAFGNYHWEAYGGTEKKSGKKCVVFKASKEGAAPDKAEAAQNAFARMRTLRHPSLLACLESAELEKELLLVTEDVEPLAAWLRGLSERPVEQAADQLLWGVESLLRALVFLNESNKLVHGAVCMDAVFVTNSGDWRLGAFDLVGSSEQASASATPLYARLGRGLLPSQTPPPELQPGTTLRTLQLAPWSVDIYGLGRLIEAALAQVPEVGPTFRRIVGAHLDGFTAVRAAEEKKAQPQA